VRVYPDDVELAVRLEGGQLTGTKRFRYLLVPDSAGAHVIANLRASYFDLGARRYATAAAAPLELTAGEGTRAAPNRRPPPDLLVADPPWLSPSGPPTVVWLALVLLPPLVAAAVRAGPRLAAFRKRAIPPAPLTLEMLHRRFRAALERVVPAAGRREGDGLDAALRAAGVEDAVAAHAARLRDRLRHSVYGRGASDPDELSAEVTEVLKAMRLGLLLLALAAPAPASAQTAERLYQAGAWRAAADSFAVRARQAPDLAAHWLNLGNARYQLGDEAGARAAWVGAARLDPRNPSIRRALRLLPASDPVSAALLRHRPLTPAELGLAAAALWVIGWTLVAARRRVRVVMIPMVLAVTAGAVAWDTIRRYRDPVGVVRRAGTPLRAAPIRSAPSRRSVEDGMAVRLAGRRGAWVLARRGTERGWLLDAEIEPVPGPFTSLR